MSFFRVPDAEVAAIESAIIRKHGAGFRYTGTHAPDPEVSHCLGGVEGERIHTFDNGESDWDKRKSGYVLERSGVLSVLEAR